MHRPEVWPWIAQIGADRGGFYSYQWLENVAGCDVRNAETVHPEWELREGRALVLHPNVPPLRVVAVERGRCFVAHAPADPRRADGRPGSPPAGCSRRAPRTEALSFHQPLPRVVRSDLATRLSFGPALLEPIGFAIDRRMLLGVKQRAEAWREVVLNV